jgi:hypothetical protein
MKETINTLAFATAAAIVAAISMLVLSVAGKMGIYTGAVEMMSQWHMFYSLTPIGIITGMVEAAIISFVFFFLFAWIYKKLA